MTTFARRLIDINGATLEVFISDGHKPLIAVTHPFAPPQGNALASLRQSHYLQSLAAAGRLVVVNPRGMGNSTPIHSPDDLTAARLIIDLDAIRQQLDAERWVVAGGSSGGVIALRYALTYPSAASGLILGSIAPSGPRLLADPHSLASPNCPDWGQDMAKEDVRMPRSKKIGSEWRQLRRNLWGYYERDMLLLVAPSGSLSERRRVALAELATFDVRDRLDEIRVPTLVLCGCKDPLIPLRHCRLLTRIPAAELVTFETGGHDPATDEPDKFRDAVQRFIARHVGTL